MTKQSPATTQDAPTVIKHSAEEKPTQPQDKVVPLFDKPTNETVKANDDREETAWSNPNILEFGQLPKENLDAEYLRLIKLDLEEAQKHLEELPESQRRGLTLETLRHFGCGYLPEWVLTKNRAERHCGLYIDKKTGKQKHLPPPSPRIIIPTPSMTHFNAVATPAARVKLNKEFWKQHAGKKEELFGDPDALNMPVNAPITVVEGEIDAMSIWQASHGKIAAVAIMGCANWKKTLLPKLPDLHGKKLLLLFDADDGKDKAKELCTELLKRGYLAVMKFLYDALPTDEQNFFGIKADANKILVERGDEHLNALLGKIIADAAHDFDDLATRIQSQNLFTQNQSQPAATEQSARATDEKTADAGNFDAATIEKVDRDEIKRILKDFVHAKDLDRNDWFKVGAILYRYGFALDDWQEWSKDDSRYSADACEYQWGTIKPAKEMKGKGYTFATLIRLAKQFGYKPSPKTSSPRAEKLSLRESKISTQKRSTSNVLPPVENQPTDDDKKVREWEKVNGVINPEILADMKAYAVKIDEIKKLDDVAKAASDTSVLKMLGMFRFYSPFAHVEKKFLANLTRKVEEAKAKVKAWNKHVKDTDKYNAACLCAKREVDTSKKPTDFEYSLAAIKPRIVNEKIDSSANAAKRDHKKWLVQHQCDELNAKRQAERQAYEEAPPTTKQEVPDCPVDLILPLGATFTDNGIKFVDWAKPPRDGRPRVVVSHNPIVPTKIFYNDADGTISYEVAIKLDNHWRTGIFPARIFNDARAVLALADYGLKISEPRLLTKFFADFFALNEKIVPNEDAPRLPRVKKFSNPGWHKIDDKKKFLDPRDLPEGVEIDAEQNGLIPHLKSQGSLDKWKETYELAKTSVIARAMINGSVAPPLLDIIGERNFMIYLKGKTRGGKTTCLLLGASAVGTEKLVRSFDATKNGLAALAADYSDYALLIDEGQVADVKHADQLRQIPYMLTNGVGRTRSDRSGKVRSADSWRTIVLATGEVDLLDPKTTPEGVITRMMTIAAPKVILPPDICSTIRENIKDNHGLAFPLIIKKISELGAAKIKDSYKGTVAALAEEYPNHLNDYRRYVATLTLADALLNAALGADFDAALDDATGNFAFPFFELIPTEQELSLTQEYVDFVHSLIAQNQSRFVGGSGFDINKPIKIMGKLDADDGYTYIIAEAFHEECERCGLNPRKVVADLVEAEFFVPDDKIEAGHKTHRPAVRKQIGKTQVRCYRIRNETLDADE